ncbi:thioredoxin family protein [Hanstruepera ponticola]|uniref:thioredoxin family protein n=1 Tax=Hanstruepera ponticola TaxID=2042995 RepID=UPI00177DEE30|nr:thioredoxin family protein [Hanstruepera ponticola]
MEVIQTTSKDIIVSALSKSITYQDYRKMVKTLVENNSTTGNDKSEAMVNYTMLNDRRMKRWDKTVKVSDEVKNRLSNFSGDVTWLVITESWCGDAAHVIPVINKIAELHDGIDLKLVLRDENDALMNQFLTNGGKAIPKLIMIDNATGQVIDTFGPRPSEATKMVNDYKATFGKLTPEFKEDLQRWYNQDKGQTAIEDLLQLLCL